MEAFPYYGKTNKLSEFQREIEKYANCINNLKIWGLEMKKRKKKEKWIEKKNPLENYVEHNKCQALSIVEV